ncbi:MAG: hypothetical protein QOG23_3383 [Blastocatellia bacterium]|jgi:hypothetical protein|nr:hypothetical protein [Blastocatellia bacterium]
MSKWSGRLGALSCGLSLAIAVHFAWRGPQPLSLCDLDRSTENYSGKVVRVRAVVSNDNGLVTGTAFHSGSDIPVFAQIALAPGQDQVLRKTKHIPHQETKKYYMADAIVVGLFDSHDDGITHCFLPRYELANARVERVISTTELDNRQEVVQWIKSNSH